MKKFLLAGAALAALMAPASAADLAVKAPPRVAAPIVSWTGFYIGAHVGYAFANNDTTFGTFGFFPTDVQSASLDDDGWVGGAQIGYNWQAAPNWLLGIEADISATGISGTTNQFNVTAGGVPIAAGLITNGASRDVDWLASVRGRIGYVGGAWLLYATGGFAWGDVSYTVNATWPGILASRGFSETETGWVLGGGLEYMMTPNWLLRAEYLYYDLGDTTLLNLPIVAFPGGAPATFENQFHVVRLGVNYKF